MILLGRLPQSYRAAVVAVLTRTLIDRRVEVAFAEKRLALNPTLSPRDTEALTRVVQAGVPRATL